MKFCSECGCNIKEEFGYVKYLRKHFDEGEFDGEQFKSIGTIEGDSDPDIFVCPNCHEEIAKSIDEAKEYLED